MPAGLPAPKIETKDVMSNGHARNNVVKHGDLSHNEEKADVNAKAEALDYQPATPAASKPLVEDSARLNSIPKRVSPSQDKYPSFP